MKGNRFYTIIIAVLITAAFMIQGFTILRLYHIETYTRDCLILNKIDYVKEKKYKSHYSYHPEKAFHVRWKDNNREDEISVSVDTFYNYKIGEEISFTYFKDDVILDILISISIFLLILEIVGFIVCYLINL